MYVCAVKYSYLKKSSACVRALPSLCCSLSSSSCRCMCCSRPTPTCKVSSKELFSLRTLILFQIQSAFTPYIHTYITHKYIHTVQTYIRTLVYSSMWITILTYSKDISEYKTYIHTYIHTCMHAYIHTYILQYLLQKRGFCFMLQCYCTLSSKQCLVQLNFQLIHQLYTCINMYVCMYIYGCV